MYLTEKTALPKDVIAKRIADLFKPKWAGAIEPIETDRDLTGVFAVPSDDPFWLAVHQVVNEVEKECIEGSRRYVGNTNQCINAVGAGEGCALIRLRLIEKRGLALKSAQPKKIA